MRQRLRLALLLGATVGTLSALSLSGCADSVTSPDADKQNPTLTITTPTEGSLVTNEATLTVAGVASDNVGVSQVTWTSSRGTSGTATGTTAWTATVTLQPGEQQLTFKALDAAGNTASDSLDVKLDGSLPSIEITTPDPTSTYFTRWPEVLVRVHVTDDSGIDRVEWSTDLGASGTVVLDTVQDSTEGVGSVWVPLVEGTQVVTATVIDKAGKSSSATLTVTSDQTPPSLLVAAPTPNGVFYTTLDSVNFAGTAADEHGIASVTWTSSTGSGEFPEGEEWAGAIGLEYGLNTIKIHAKDGVGNVTEDTVAITRFREIGSLLMSESAILTNRSDSIQVTFTAAAGIQLANGEVVLQIVDTDNIPVDTVGILSDDGDPASGDKIQGDGVYSGMFVFAEATEVEFRMQVSASVMVNGMEVEGRSPWRRLGVYSPPTADEELVLETTQNKAVAILDSLLDVNSLEDAVPMLAAYVEGLDGVKSVRASGVRSISIEYESGLRGGLFLDQGLGTKGGGALTHRDGPASTPSADALWRATQAGVPAPMQTRGATRATTRQEIADRARFDSLANRKVLIYAPFEREFSPYNEGPELEKIFNASSLGFEVTYLKNAAADVEALTNLTDYGTIVISTHGLEDEVDGGYFLTGESVYGTQTEHAAEVKAGQIGAWAHVTTTNGASTKGKFWAIYPEFIRELEGQFRASLVVNSSCFSTKSDVLWRAFKSKGAEAYFGFDDEVGSPFATKVVVALMDSLVNDPFPMVHDAFEGGQTDPQLVGAEFEFYGNSSLRYATGSIASVKIAERVDLWYNEWNAGFAPIDSVVLASLDGEQQLYWKALDAVGNLVSSEIDADSVTWETESFLEASVDSYGLVKAESEGTTVVTVTVWTVLGSFSDSVTVIVDTPPTLSITTPTSDTILNLDEGREFVFRATASDVLDGDLTDNVRWYRTLPESVDGDQELVGTGGTLTITLPEGRTTLAASVSDKRSSKASDTVSVDAYVPVAEVWTDSENNAPNAMILKTDGTLWAVGENGRGQLGDGTTIHRHSPVQIMTGVASVSMTRTSAMIVKTDGTLWAVGANEWGQLGDGTTIDRHSPVQIMTGVESVSHGNLRTMIVKTDGTILYSRYVLCATTDGRATEFSKLDGPPDVASVSDDSGCGGLAVTLDGTLWALWAPFLRHELSDTTTESGWSRIMTGVASADDFNAVDANTWILKRNGTLWHAGSYLVEDGVPTHRTPVQIMSDVKSFAGNQRYVMMVKTDQTLWGIGSDWCGEQSGIKHTPPPYNTMFPLQQRMTGVASVSIGDGGAGTMIVKTDGTLWAAGFAGCGIRRVIPMDPLGLKGFLPY